MNLLHNLPHNLPHGPQGPKFSEILTTIAEDKSRDRISVADLLVAAGDRAFGVLIFIFAVPNILPTPPGTSSVLGAPLIFLAIQLSLGRATPWLPKFIAKRSMLREDFAATIGRISPWLGKVEKLLKPRLSFLARPPIEQAIGLLCFVLSLMLILPIPLGNMLPAFTICLFSLAILERDGICALLGFIAGSIAIAIVWSVLYALLKSALFVFANQFQP